MFTGLIQALGTIKPLGGDYWKITCVTESSDTIMRDLAIGDSVAVDGICLTVEEVLKDGFIATASPETLRRTTLGQEQTEQKYVNLEASLRVGSKVGGHFVMGHVDGVGKMLSKEETATSWEMTFSATGAIARYIVPKGSIAVNGISLTVAEYQPETMQFKVAVIPLTYAETNLRYLNPGSWVNLEGDILGKYVEKFLSSGKGDVTAPTDESSDDISLAFLAEHGY
ncbi:riboflavin synthase [Aetokthonos hydrillicola Thurmond2011]|uniref:Riboflavin synthase n=1 Tax=Aetokthonos hydrillicola Thurmond2011 TaxID=2712845 RepID=A0AAP5MC13_9CYAN|nr:riboflavin synthase [Aetokthonos hydrillicola]MBO3457151.1 riboflavin synthase [Aetokthonos hydrillicola CCALA 1050]MBW4587498.1 riboflavin synthase [Aetokthonos hydrillicola CCALA 1050]MDR9898637.1 riboflavin synthase [Aetokthonos hydrillicola Thurmond2011]